MRRFTGIVLAASLCGFFAAGQTTTLQPRRAMLRGHIHPALREATDLGRAPSDVQFSSLRISFKMSAEKQAELEATLAAQQDPASPQFHRWLTPEDYAARFGASDADVAALSSWLTSRGLTVKEVSRGRNSVEFNGSQSDVEAAFATEIHRYSIHGESHFANATEPSVPAAFEGKVQGIHGLHDFRLRSPKPRYTSSTTGNHYLVPNDFATIYNVKPLYDQGITGAGQKVVVVGQTRMGLTDLQLFRTNFNLPAKDPQLLLVPNTVDPGTSSGDVGEATLDIDWVGAVARDASIIYVYSKDVSDALFYAVDQNLAPVISMSYGLCESGFGLTDTTFLRTYSQRAALQGITWVASSGDSGAADCFVNTSRTVATLAVDAPASLPEVTGIGGTTMNEGSGNYWAATNDANRASALSYIPETSWNDSTTGNLSSSGGGASLFFTKPSWQTGTGVPADGARDVPDISLSASAQHVGYIIYQGGSQQAIGGTSAGAPSFAGMVALLNQYQVAHGLQASPGMGNVNPRLYSLAASVPNAFHDITTGNNLVNPCSTRIVTCTSDKIGYNAGVGYDQVTGLGTVDAFNMITGWGAGTVVTKALVTISLTTASANISQSGSTVVTATVTSANGTTPTGTVSFYAGSALLGTATLSGGVGRGSAILTLQGSQVAIGQVSLTAKYSGDATFADITSSPATITVAAATAITITGAVNAASYKSVAAPGMILAVYGFLLAGNSQSAPTVPLPITLGGATATINDVPCPLYYVSPTQINLQVPYTVGTGTWTLRVTYNNQTATSSINIAAAAPGIFMNFATNAPVPDEGAKRGQTITLYVTGDGVVSPTTATGSLPLSGTTPRTVQSVSVAVGGFAAPIAYLGVPSWAIGVTQINYTVPLNAPLGSVPVVVTVGGVPSASLNLNVTQ